jgi:hypothetical protein
MQNHNNENSLLAQLSGAKQKSRPRGITIYLAGKISKNDWRHKLVPELHDSPLNESVPVTESPIVENGIAPGLHYSGPHFVGCDHGCFHGAGTHGAIDDGKNCGSGTPAAIPYKDRHLVAFACLWQIRRSNIVFAWIEAADAYGTLVEIGVATGLRKTIWLGGPERIPEHWFSHCLVDCISFEYADPAEFFAACLSDRFGAFYTAKNGRIHPTDGNAVFRN